MSYEQKDRSVEAGEPVEFYKFVGELDVYRYTTDNVPGVCDGELYLPLPGGIGRTAIEVTGVVSNLITNDIDIPADTELAKRYCYKITPGMISVEIRRAHRGDDWNTQFQLEWRGYGLETSVTGDRATIKTGSLIQSALNGNLSAVYYQRLCNHELGDARCKIDRSLYSRSSTIVKVQHQIITVAYDGGIPGLLDAGNMIVERTGENRVIFTNENNIVTVAFPFLDIRQGDTVKMLLGCDHQRTGHCRKRFNNVKNYGGFDFVPKSNIVAVVNTTTETHIEEKTRSNGFWNVFASMIRFFGS